MQSPRSVAGFWILAAMLLVSVASSAVPSPIYPVYAAEWHLTPLMLTAVFAIYVAGLLLSLLIAGRLSDHVGRKPVLVVGGLGVAVSLGLFAVADGLGALIVDRIVQGVSVGLLIGALGAALIDNSLERHPALAGVLDGATSRRSPSPPVHCRAGHWSSGVRRRSSSSTCCSARCSAAGLALVVVPEQVSRRPGRCGRSVRRCRCRGPPVGCSAASPGRSCPAGRSADCSCRSCPPRSGSVRHPEPLRRRRPDRRRHRRRRADGPGDPARRRPQGGPLGLVALILGPIVTVAFVFAPSLPGLVVGSAIAGVGFGAGFQAPLRMLLATAAPTHRAGLLSTIYVVSYLAFGVPSVIGGFLEPSVGLVPVSPVRGVHRPRGARRPRAAGRVEGRGRGGRGRRPTRSNAPPPDRSARSDA